MVELRRALLAASLASGLACAGEAPADLPPAEAPPAAAPRAPGAGAVHDPWESYNRKMFRFNMAIDRAVLRPIARGYRSAMPAPARTGVSNFLDNLEQPLSSVNQLLQGKPLRAGSDLARFLVNLTFGIGGFLDPAATLDLPVGDEDFGQTFGRWGIGPGPYLVLPFMPARGVRDWFGEVGDVQLEPSHYLDGEGERIAANALDLVEQRYRLLDLDEALDSAYDPYVFVRDAWAQRREYKVRDGAMPPVDYDDLYEDPLEDAPAEEPPPGEAPPR